MRVLVAGATGALGRPIVRRLVARGDDVIGLSRSAERGHRVEAQGVRVVVADALDAGALDRVVADTRPDVVVHALTALPPGGPTRAVDLVATNLVRTSATKNLVEASVARGVRRIVAESFILVHGYGDRGRAPVAEETPPETQAPAPWLQPTVDAGLELEREVLSARARGVEAVVVRCGLLHGSTVPSTEFMVRMMRRWMMPVPGRGDGALPFVHVEDAAEAFALAVHAAAPGPLYDIVDDEAVTVATYWRAVAHAVGALRPLSAPMWLLRLFAPYVAVVAATSIRVSNGRAKAELGWSPRYPTYREAIEELRAARYREREFVART